MQPEEMTPADLPMRDTSPDASSPPTPALLQYQVELGELTLPAPQAPDQVQITAMLAGQCPGTEVQTWTYDYVNIGPGKYMAFYVNPLQFELKAGDQLEIYYVIVNRNASKLAELALKLFDAVVGIVGLRYQLDPSRQGVVDDVFQKMEQAIAAANDGTVAFQQWTFSSSDLEQKTSSDGWYRQQDATYDVALLIHSVK